MEGLQVVYLPPNELTPYENNTRKHVQRDIEQIKASIEADGFNDPIGIWGENNLIVEGHGRQIAALEMGMEKVPCIRLDHLTETQRKDYAIRHNRTAELSEWDFSKLEEEIAALAIEGVDLSGLDFDLDGAAEDIEYTPEEEHKGSMRDKYLVPPFSVLYANKPDWLARKRAWVALGLHSEIGRGGQLTYNSRSNPAANLVHRGGYKEAEMSKAFKNNARLNRYMTKAKRTQTD